MDPKTLNDWIGYIEKRHPDAIALGLERVEQVRRALALDPDCVIITVAGTNGKGSTCAFLEAVLMAAGYRVGCYTSPHLHHINERFRVNAREVSDQALADALARVEAARGDIPLTYFEYTTLAAGLLFKDAGVDVAILEVGMGGRLDAVNVFDGDCAIVTSVDIDHAEYLGGTRELIGFEKAGVFRRGRPAVYAEPDMPASVREHARDIGTRLMAFGKDFHCEPRGDRWCYAGPRGNHDDLPMPSLSGRYQLRNAGACITALAELADRLVVSREALDTGLVRANLPGRFHKVMDRPLVIVDVAHNPHAVRGLLENLACEPCAGRTLAVFSMLRDKDIPGVLNLVSDVFDQWLLPEVRIPRGMKAEDLATMLRAAQVRGEIGQYASPRLALEEALGRAGPMDRVVVFGSFFVAGEALQCIHEFVGGQAVAAV